MKNIHITPILYGRSVLRESSIFHGGRPDSSLPIVFMVYLIQCDGKLILVDAGCETMPGFVMKDFNGTIAALKNHGYRPEDITDLVITHAHHDHIECAKYFPWATVYIQEEEYKKGARYLESNPKVVTFSEEYRLSQNIVIKRIGGHTVGSSVVEINTAETCYVIAGDECYLREVLDKKLLTGASVCKERSLSFLNTYSQKEYTVLLSHEA